jgi:hypothetical protein
MPRAYRVRATRPPLADAGRRWLLHGEEPPDDATGHEVYFELRFLGRRLWDEHRDELLAGWIAERPGTRPYAWFEYDLPHGAERRKVAGSGEQSAVWFQHEAFYALADCDPADPPQIESMAVFLRRLGLLVPGEERRIPKRAWKPETLKVDPEGWAPFGVGGYDPDEAVEEGHAAR